jgi:hypothetical protein
VLGTAGQDKPDQPQNTSNNSTIKAHIQMTIERTHSHLTIGALRYQKNKHFSWNPDLGIKEIHHKNQ